VAPTMRTPSPGAAPGWRAAAPPRWNGRGTGRPQACTGVGHTSSSRFVMVVTRETGECDIKERADEDQTDQRARRRPEKARRFYTEVPGFVKKADFSQGPFAGSRWLHRRIRTARSCSCR
jgi:hypothetical protein